jgi:choline dehydrogenase
MRNAVATARAMLRGKSVEIAEGKTTKGSATTGFRVPWSLEVLPGPLFLYANMDATFNAYSSMTANTYYHACGTCPMEVKRKKGSKSSASSAAAPAADAVVDAQLRVKGVRGLRIADASVFPAIPSGPIAATVMAVGYGAAELILAANPNSASASSTGVGAKR